MQIHSGRLGGRKEYEMTPAGSSATAVGEIRRLIDTWVEAVRARDSRGMVSGVAADVVLFDVVNPLQSRGVEMLQQRGEEWLASFQGPVGYEMKDLQITAGEDVAFCHSLNHVSVMGAKGKVDMWWRATVGFRKIDGQWMVTHEHSSVPFDMGTGKASLNLKP